MRLDKFLSEKIPGVSRTKIQKAIKNGLVLVNGEKVIETDFQVKPEDNVALPEFESDELKPYNLELKIVFENADLAVIDKPAGLVVHPGAGNKENTLANALLSRFPGVDKVGEPHRPGIVHRLDEYTSGLIIIAKTMKGFEHLKKLFLDHKVEKEYLALVHGIPAKKHDIINLSLEKVPLKQKMSVRDGPASGGKAKEAITEYFVIAESPSGQYALLRIKLHTGRTHQIRAHLSYIGHPLVGDQLYGSTYPSRQFLHAHRLKFQLLDGSWIELFSKLPQDLEDILSRVGIKYDNYKF